MSFVLLTISVDDATDMFGCSLVRRRSRLGVVPREHLGAMSLTLRNHADVESSIEELG
jgi:hypothetical protein